MRRIRNQEQLSVRHLLFHHLSIFVILTMFIACGQEGAQIGISQPLSSYSPQPGNLRFSLTDAPLDDVQSVIVQVDRVEALLEKDGERSIFVFGEDMGPIDLLTLQDGKTLALADLVVTDGVKLQQMRVILEPEGNHLIHKNGDICELKTPSAQQTGLKIPFEDAVLFSGEYSHSVVIDFDAAESVVQRGVNDCLLKPVIRLANVTRLPLQDIGEDGDPSDPANEEEYDAGEGDSANEGNDGNDGSDTTTVEIPDDFDPLDPSTWPEGININDPAFAIYF